MSTEKNEEEILYRNGRRVCGSRDTATGEPCMRYADRSSLTCFRHSGERGPNGSKPKRGKSWLDVRTGIDTSYVEKLHLNFDPEAADLQFEIELTNRHISALTKEYDAALRDVKAGRTGPNPRAILAQLSELFQTKTRLVKAQTQRVMQAKDYVTRDQLLVHTHVFIYLASRHIPKDRLRQFFDEARLCVDAPWRVSELTLPKGLNAREAHAQAKHLFEVLWAEQHQPVPNDVDDAEDGIGRNADVME